MEAMNEELEKTYEDLMSTNNDLNNEREILNIFKQFAEASGNSLGMTDLKGHITYVNSAFCKIAGVKNSDNVLGTNIGDFYTEENKIILTEAVLPNVMNREQVIVEMKLIPADGSIRHTIQNFFLIRDNKNRPINYAFVITDITEMKGAEKALRESEERYRLLVETMNEGLVVVDEDNRITYCNSRFCEMIQYECTASLGRSIGDFLDEKNREIVDIESEKRKEGDHSTYEVEFRRSDGHSVPVTVSPRPIFNSEGEYIGSFAIITDISYRKRTEHELLKTSKIESLGVFAGGIAHDFNNFLTAIIGNISILKINMNKNSENFEILKDAQKAAIRAKNLTQQLLTFSKGGKPVKKVTPVENLLKESASFVLSGSNIVLKFDISKGIWDAEIDEGQMSQVFHNLVINARQAMPGGGVIRIFAENISLSGEERLPLSAGDYIRIIFQDNGPGIKSENINNIFDPFFTTKEEGSGLGLAISYSIIKKHDGDISVESKPGTGTIFTLYLPARKNIPQNETEEQKKRYRGSGRILVMDDDKSIVNTVSKMLKFFGFRVDSAADGKDAIIKYKKALATEDPYRMVILDLTIPGKMGGRDAVNELKNIDPDVKAVVSSGYSNDPVMANYSEYGFTAVVKKPFIIEELEDVLYAVLDN
jgi:PAS domain S-box-containing protein